MRIVVALLYTVAVDAEAHAVYAGTDGGLWKLPLQVE